MAIYKITNKITGQIYIGQTTKVDPLARIAKHFNNSDKHNFYYFQRAIVKYGQQNFSVYILDETTDIQLLNDLEQYYINFFNCLAPNGYNLKAGGKQGGKCSELTKRKISDALTGIKTAQAGKPKSEAHRLAMSRSRKGKPQTPARTLVIEKLRVTLGYPIRAVNMKTNELTVFASIEECARQLNLTASCISRVLRNDQNRTQHKGWTFERIT